MLCLTDGSEILKNNGTITDEAYSTPVDLWSIGCITVILLAGEVLFADRNQPAYEQNPHHFVTTLASKCDLGILDDEDHHVWGHVGSNPKDFIKNLLVLNEGSRMTATEALNHAWFSHNYYADDFDALYERSIRDWRPHRKVYRPVERIQGPSQDSYTASQPERVFSEDVVSQLFSQASQQASDHVSSEDFGTSRHRQAPLSPIAEECAYTHGDCPSQFELQLYDINETGYSQHSTRRLQYESMGNSMGQLTLDTETAQTYAENGNSIDQDNDRYGYDEDIDEAMYGLDQQGNLQVDSVKPCMPETEEVLQDHRVVYETPKSAQRYHSSPSAPRAPKPMRPF
jgi:pheromone a factor receptor